MNTLTRTGFALLFALLVLPCQAEPATKQAGPAMWVVSDADTRIYLFGTFHLLPKGVAWETEAFRKAMADTAISAIEVDTESDYARRAFGLSLREHGMNPSWQSLRGVLGAERYGKLAEVVKRYNLSLDKAQSYRPWFVMLLLEIEVMTANGFSREFGVERNVLKRAFAERDRVLTMETPEAQVKALATLDTQEALEGFDVTMSDLLGFKSKVEPMLTAWRTGDTNTLDRLASADMRRIAPGAYRALIVNRNANWVDRLTGWLKGKGTYFVAVGAAHLAGPDSVINMLEKRGFKATRVQ
jgi:uncharacterized protein YbaP (TraB family)